MWRGCGEDKVERGGWELDLSAKNDDRESEGRRGVEGIARALRAVTGESGPE